MYFHLLVPNVTFITSILYMITHAKTRCHWGLDVYTYCIFTSVGSTFYFFSSNTACGNTTSGEWQRLQNLVIAVWIHPSPFYSNSCQNKTSRMTNFWSFLSCLLNTSWRSYASKGGLSRLFQKSNNRLFKLYCCLPQQSTTSLLCNSSEWLHLQLQVTNTITII